MPRLILLCLLLMVSACTSLRTRTLEPLPLPLNARAGCCWQAVQQLEVTYDGETHAMQAALAYSEAGPGLVLLDPMGQRLLSIHSHNGELTTYRSALLPEVIPARFFLAVSMLSWWPLDVWQTLPENWSLTHTDDSRMLSEHGRPLLDITYLGRGGHRAARLGLSEVTAAQKAVISHHQLPLSIAVATIQWEKL